MQRALLAIVLTLAIAAPAAAWLPPVTPRISDIHPTLGRPQGGEMVMLTAHDCRPPLRVFFELGDASVEGLVVWSTDRQIAVMTPAVAFAEGEQSRTAEIVLESDGRRVKAPKTFLFENELLQPKILATVPASGRAGTHVTLFGEAFQQPVQVLFGTREARVFNASRDQVIVEVPRMCDAGTVDITVRNIHSATTHTLPAAFHYEGSHPCDRRGILKPPRATWDPGLAIDSVAPSVAQPVGGALVSIRGRGFEAPVRVVFDLGDQELEAEVAWVNDREVVIRTPIVPFGPGEQFRVAEIVLTTRGFSVDAPVAFLFENTIQYPKIVTVSPKSGPAAGSTRIQVFGEGFQQPVQVFFWGREARVLRVERHSILVEAPLSRVCGAGSVDVTVRNYTSATEFTLANAFRYVDPPRCARGGIDKPPKAH